jgi:hypothetical protein
VDSEGFPVRDSLGEIGSLYATMLGVDDDYMVAFRRGYEEFFSFPDDAATLILDAAISCDIDSLAHMVGQVEGDSSSEFKWRAKEMPDWLKRWITNRFSRLQGWFDSSRRVKRAMYRGEVGPW